MRFLVGCRSPFMKLAGRPSTLRAWCEQCLSGRPKPDMLRPDIGGTRGFMAIRLRPCSRSSTPPALSRPRPPPLATRSVATKVADGHFIARMSSPSLLLSRRPSPAPRPPPPIPVSPSPAYIFLPPPSYEYRIHLPGIFTRTVLSIALPLPLLIPLMHRYFEGLRATTRTHKLTKNIVYPRFCTHHIWP